MAGATDWVESFACRGITRYCRHRFRERWQGFGPGVVAGLVVYDDQAAHRMVRDAA